MKDKFKRHPYWFLVLLAFFAGGYYWSFWATDRYVSEATVVLQGVNIGPPTLNFTSILTGGGSHDLLMLREHMLSVDMLKKLDAELDLRAHFSDRQIDVFSRLRAPDVPIEDFHRYYLTRVSVKLDEYAQVLRIRSEAFDPQTAQRIALLLLREGEAHINALGQRLAAEQVRFIERQVQELNERVRQAQEAVLAYQNEHGLVSPTGTVQGLSAIVASLEGELAKLSARRQALAASHSSQSPEMIRLDAEIQALKNQIRREQARLADGSGQALNRVTAEFEALRMQLEFALEMYSTARAALESTRVEAARTLKQVSILQNPTYPEYPTEPRRLYNIAVFTLLLCLGGIIAHLIAAIIRDHYD